MAGTRQIQLTSTDISCHHHKSGRRGCMGRGGRGEAGGGGGGDLRDLSQKQQNNLLFYMMTVTRKPGSR